MVFNVLTVGYKVTPVVISTFISHYLHRGRDNKQPEISYDEGIHLIRRFLAYASQQTVEDVQAFTAPWVPHPSWVKVDHELVPTNFMVDSAEYIAKQLGDDGISKIGGPTWWQWRRIGGEMKVEWIEMKSDYVRRQQLGPHGGKRVMLYVHGGAYFFGSTDEHRYQIQRHARKLQARVMAPRYRLAPQFPFPCGLYDCLAAYLYLLTLQDPSTIVLAGDSAGGGMVLSMLVIMRDQGIPMPAGAILISPWVDLTHSFPSVGQENPMDYIPPHGFHQKPSASWPPPNSDDLAAFRHEKRNRKGSTASGKARDTTQHQSNAEPIESMADSQDLDPVSPAHIVDDTQDQIQGFSVNGGTTMENQPGNEKRSPDSVKNFSISNAIKNLSISIDGHMVEIKDQIQMYTTNELISHPLVSPVLQPTLGGLPPLLVMVGGGEMLRDEQIYLAHKAAHPQEYAPDHDFLNDKDRAAIRKWKPTDVQLQIWDDLCHVAPTLSFTRPAKYMYRSVAQFGAWALARAQKTAVDIIDDDNISIISDEDKDVPVAIDTSNIGAQVNKIDVDKAGDSLPAFEDHMIRQRVSRKGIIRPLEDASLLPACTIPSEQIGIIKEAPVRKWMAEKKMRDSKYATRKRKVQKERIKEISSGYETFDGPFGSEIPPPSALAGRRLKKQEEVEAKKKRSYTLSIWSSWGSKHDKVAIQQEEEVSNPDTTTATPAQGQNARPLHDNVTKEGYEAGITPDSIMVPRRRSSRVVRDAEQTNDDWSPNAQIEAKSTPSINTIMPSKRIEPSGISAIESGPGMFTPVQNGNDIILPEVAPSQSVATAALSNVLESIARTPSTKAKHPLVRTGSS